VERKALENLEAQYFSKPKQHIWRKQRSESDHLVRNLKLPFYSRDKRKCVKGEPEGMWSL
jgi:phosphoribosyl-AMP cyclohydrolase